MICPWCDTDQRRRRGGKCPGCGEEVEIYRENGKSYWVAEKPSTRELVMMLEEKVRVRENLSWFCFGGYEDAAYRRELHLAKLLIKRCGMSQELARLVIECYFSTKGLYPPKSMAGIVGKQFSYALAHAKRRMDEKHKKQRAQERRIDTIDEQFTLSTI
jgi:hypothetical protein